MVVVPDANLFDLTETVDLSRRPARKPNWIDVFLLWLVCVRVHGHGGIVGGCVSYGVGVHDRRSGEREAES